MKAAAVREFGQPLVIEDRPIPLAGHRQVTGRMETSGLCHTDIHAADGDWPVKPTPRFVPGHEGAGLVHAMEGPTDDRHNRRSAARQDLDLLVGDLSAVCGQLEEVATMWRRQCHARNSWLDMPHAFPQGLRSEAGQLAGTLRALVEAGPDPDLAFSAVTQLSALDAGLAAAVAGASRGLAAAVVTEDACGSTQPRAADVRATMSRVRTRQRSLIAHLVKGHGRTAEGAA